LIQGSTRGKAPITDLVGQLGWTRVNVRIKITIIIVLKSDLGVNQGKAPITVWESQHELTRVNIWITMVIIIVLKPDLGVDPRQDLGHGSRGSTLLTWIYPELFINFLNLDKFRLRSTHQVSSDFITKVIIILIIQHSI
jgi:hypothetical protein